MLQVPVDELPGTVKLLVPQHGWFMPPQAWQTPVLACDVQ